MSGLEAVTPVPPHILDLHRSVTPGIVVMKVIKLTFLISYGRIVKFGTTTGPVNTEVPSIVSVVTLILKTYGIRGSNVKFVAADNSFVPLLQYENFLSFGITLNLTLEDEHEPFSERYIRSIK